MRKGQSPILPSKPQQWIDSLHVEAFQLFSIQSLTSAWPLSDDFGPFVLSLCQKFPRTERRQGWFDPLHETTCVIHHEKNKQTFLLHPLGKTASLHLQPTLFSKPAAGSIAKSLRCLQVKAAVPLPSFALSPSTLLALLELTRWGWRSSHHNRWRSKFASTRPCCRYQLGRLAIDPPIDRICKRHLPGNRKVGCQQGWGLVAKKHNEHRLSAILSTIRKKDKKSPYKKELIYSSKESKVGLFLITELQTRPWRPSSKKKHSQSSPWYSEEEEQALHGVAASTQRQNNLRAWTPTGFHFHRQTARKINSREKSHKERGYVAKL